MTTDYPLLRRFYGNQYVDEWLEECRRDREDQGDVVAKSHRLAKMLHASPQDVEDFVIKGRRFPVGTVRTWKGGKFRKEADGKWVELAEGGDGPTTMRTASTRPARRPATSTPPTRRSSSTCPVSICG